jgi:hypothetical protein
MKSQIKLPDDENENFSTQTKPFMANLSAFKL